VGEAVDSGSKRGICSGDHVTWKHWKVLLPHAKEMMGHSKEDREGLERQAHSFEGSAKGLSDCRWRLGRKYSGESTPIPSPAYTS
jgi:hypothetical protein